jgi:hypothetical protein
MELFLTDQMFLKLELQVKENVLLQSLLSSIKLVGMEVLNIKVNFPNMEILTL